MSPFLIPLAVFAMIVLIVAISSALAVRNLEMEVHRNLYAKQMEHQRKMRELGQELERIRQGS